MKTTYTVHENNAGGLLLTMTCDGETALLFTFDATGMAEYVVQLREDTEMEGVLYSASPSDIVDADDIPTILSADNGKLIADNNGLYLDSACVAGTDMINAVYMTESPMVHLNDCDTTAEIIDLVEKFSDLICDTDYLAHRNGWKRAEYANSVCKILYDRAELGTFDGLNELVANCQQVCEAIFGDVSLSLSCYRTTGEAENESCSWEEATRVELSCHGFRLRDANVPEYIAYLVDGDMLKHADTDIQDEYVAFIYDKA